MPNPIKVSAVVADVELIETVLQRVLRSPVDGEVTVTAPPSGSQCVPVSSANAAAGTARYKVIQGL